MLALFKKEHTEKLLVALIFTGIFLPVRLLFYNYVSQYWLGSFGVMSVTLVLLFYFSYRGKLGWLGGVILRHMERFSKGKIGLGVLVSTGVVIYFFGNVIYGIESAPIPLKDLIQTELKAQGIESIEDVSTHTPKADLDIPTIILGVILLVTPNPVAYSIDGIINDMSQGWLMHWASVIILEQIEVLGLVIYFRYVKKN